MRVSTKLRNFTRVFMHFPQEDKVLPSNYISNTYPIDNKTSVTSGIAH